MASHRLGPVEEFPPGTHRVVAVGRAGVQVGVFNVGGRFHALPNVCPHQFGPLCEGGTTGTLACGPETGWRHEWVRDGEVVVCPWHGLEFDITTGQCLAVPRWKLRTYAVTVDEGEVTLTL